MNEEKNVSEHPLHPSIIAMVSMAANIAAKHPKNGLCQLDKLKQMGVSQSHINTVVEIARHLRDEAGEILDYNFEESIKNKNLNQTISTDVCCTTTDSGQSCC